MPFMCFQVAYVSDSLMEPLILDLCWASRSLLHPLGGGRVVSTADLLNIPSIERKPKKPPFFAHCYMFTCKEGDYQEPKDDH